MNLFDKTQERLIRYAKINTRSDAFSPTTPSTTCQFDLLHLLVEELKEIGMQEVQLNPENAFVTATLPGNMDNAPSIGFIAHVDTADFNSENVQPNIIPDYDGKDIVLNEAEQIVMTVSDFPNLANYQGQTLITTDGTTLLGADDKAGIAEIMTAMEYLIAHPEIPHGKIRVAFGPDEEIGRGADKFDVEHFACDFAYTMDGGPVGELQYESFNAAGATIKIQGKNIHPGTAKGKMLSAIDIANQLLNLLPAEQVPEKTEGREGFIHVTSVNATVEEATIHLIIRDHDRQLFNAKKALVTHGVTQLNAKYPTQPVSIQMHDDYYNMAEVIEKDMRSVEIAKQAMKDLGIEPIIEPIRGGTDGSKISFMGLPTPNIFAGGENMHGRFEYVAVESMVKATEVIIKIVELATQ
ncbi:peptidase T [Aerococcaceae bacterium NML210727]|nr:peptidase T [Aerococcaceae bacterium NML210727]MCW6654070.1 peptidase T [Aerococcaceae bacterium NML201296]MCW6661407.1 peptidase T [Aerococcaceae bacterium NML201209]MCW6663134.1 peptidase T [Aerococcaceae bacterium NML190073]MCW6664984.1 peptidase T [Aerococcaceae bacterium NML191219]MCW6680794.1 peptidase T [Aerococcaceae bacterium NML130460]